SLAAAVLCVIVLGAPGIARAHDQTPPTYKWANGLLLSWSSVSTDRMAKQISVADEHGQVTAQFNILRIVPEARRVSIYDVSANRDLIAVAAVYESKEGNKKVRPTAALLIFDGHGKLRFASALGLSHAIARLVVDDDSNIWTLTDGAGTEVSPAKVPVVVEYTSDGREVREVLTRDMFPFHALDTKSDVIMGSAVMGCDSGVVWFWLPGSTELVTIATGDGKPDVRKTELPKKPGRREVVLAIYREPSGNVVGQFREDDDQLRPSVPADVVYYAWHSSTGVWSEFGPTGCESMRMIGMSERGPVYMEKMSRTQMPNLCITGME